MLNGFIYCIFSNLDKSNNLYIGSTIDILRRIRSHRYNCKKTPELQKIYTHINETGGILQYKILETKFIENRKELYLLEKEYILKYTNDNINLFNICIPTRSNKEYYNDNKKKLIEESRQYYKDNKNNILTRKKTVMKLCPDCGRTLTKNHFARHLESTIHINHKNKIFKSQKVQTLETH